MQYLNASQCRAARGLLKWSQPDLSAHSGVNIQTICGFENETGTPTKRTLQKITSAFEIGGVSFTDDGGIAPRGLKSRHLTGAEGLKELLDDTYEQAAGGAYDIRLWNAKPSNWIKRLGDEWFAMHAERMRALLPDLTMNITCKEGETNFISGPYATYRYVPENMFNDQSIYCYGNRLAFVSFEESGVNIYILYKQAFGDSFRLLFDEVWNTIARLPDVQGYGPDAL